MCHLIFCAGVISNSLLSIMNGENMRLLEAGESCGTVWPFLGSVIVYGGISINAEDAACSECERFPLEQKVILMQIGAGRLSTVLAYKRSLLCC